MNNQESILKIFEEFKTIITNSHVVYASGKHGSTYVNKDAIYPHTAKMSDLCCIIAKQFINENVKVVIAPAVGGVILSQWVAYHLSNIVGYEVLGVYADKSDDGKNFIIKRGYDKLVSGKNILVVEDILTTGGSVKKVIEATRAVGGNVIGLGALCNRGGITSQDVADIPKLFSLITIGLESWDEKDCPLCAQNVPINTDIGKGREFLARKQA